MMKNTNFYGFMAAIFVPFVIQEFDFDTFKFESLWKGILFLAGFFIFAFLAFTNRKRNVK